jgi:hypothetical protein
MAVLGCLACEIVIVQKVAEGTKVPCPACGKPMVPKSGPGSPDIQFPQEPSRESVLDLDLSEQLRKALQKKAAEKKAGDSKRRGSGNTKKRTK